MSEPHHDDEGWVPQFSLQDFKHWMMKNGSASFSITGNRKSEGAEVEPRISPRKLLARMEAEDGDIVEMVKEFREQGGRVTEANGDSFLIDLSCGTFRIPRACVKRKV